MKYDLTIGDFLDRALAGADAKIGDIATLAHFTPDSGPTRWTLFPFTPRTDSGWHSHGEWRITRLAVRSRDWEGQPDSYTAWIKPA